MNICHKWLIQNAALVLMLGAASVAGFAATP